MMVTYRPMLLVIETEGRGECGHTDKFMTDLIETSSRTANYSTVRLDLLETY